ncbi:MAG: type II 3-dehydroquinate dehydratase [Alphaproteobacteria bacterium]|nr:type II 3-dehydroquinate dehydratase [Alphaproteobacteria bacterium]
MPAPQKSNLCGASAKSAAAPQRGGDVLILSGPNLNLLGVRETNIYGKTTLADIELDCLAVAKELKLSIEFCQSNSESELINWVQQSRGAFRAIIINAGGYTHTSVALMDALMLTELPIYEVHLSNIFRRESFRHHSYISYAATGVICGLGAAGYTLALRAVAQNLQTKA